MVKIDRVSGKQLFAGNPTDDPKSSIIWEAFKADTEARRTTRRDELAAQRDQLLAAIRRGSAPAEEAVIDEAAPAASPSIAADSTVTVQ